MKGRMCICCVVVLLSALPAGVWAQEDLIPKGDEVLFGTWVNAKAPADLLHGQKVVVSEEEMNVFVRLDDKAPWAVIAWEIHRKWTDSEGNAWYETFGRTTGGAQKRATWQALEKISDSGRTWERAAILLEYGGFNPAFFPRSIDPKSAYYRILYRVQE